MTMQEYIEQSLQKYDPDLVTMFKNEHDELLSQYEDLLDSRYKEKDSKSALYQRLNEYCVSLINHFHHEDHQIYVHLTNTLGKRKNVQTIVQQLRDNMYEIEDNIQTILKENDPACTQWCWEMMPDTLERLGEVLKQRIDVEEALLFPIYKASGPDK